MVFLKAFNIKRGDVVSITGSGGKTSLMKLLALYCAEAGYKVLITTSTRLSADELLSFKNAETSGELFCNKIVSLAGVYASARLDGEKALAPDLNNLACAKSKFDIIFIESDGSANKNLKGWAVHEPVISELSNKTIGVVDIKTVDTRVSDENVHRFEKFSEITGLKEGEALSVQHLKMIAESDKGIFQYSGNEKYLYINKAETGNDIKNAEELSSIIDIKAVMGSVKQKYLITQKPDAVVMASGFSKRLGENKLLLDIGGKSVFEHFISKIPFDRFRKIIVVYSDDAVEKIASGYSVENIKNIEPEKGKRHTIKLGLKELKNSCGVMFFVADQPFLTTDSIVKLIDKYNKNRSNIIIPVCLGKRRNPVIFPQSVLAELAELNTDIGGRAVIDKYPELIDFCELNECEQFLDIDTYKDYERAKQVYDNR